MQLPSAQCVAPPVPGEGICLRLSSLIAVPYIAKGGVTRSLEIYLTAGPAFPTAGAGDSRSARISRTRKSTLTTCAITKRPVPGLPAHNSRQRAQTSVAARNIIALMRRWNFPTSAAVRRAGFLQAAELTACADLVNSQPVFVVPLEQLEVFAFRAAVLVLLREIFKSLHGKVARALVVLLRDKFHDPRPSEHHGRGEMACLLRN